MTAIETIQALCDLTKEHGSTFEVATDQCGLYLDVKIPGHEMSIRYYVSDSQYPGLLAERHPELDKAIREHCRGMIGWLEEWGKTIGSSGHTHQSVSGSIGQKKAGWQSTGRQ